MRRTMRLRFPNYLSIARFHFDVVLLVLPEYSFSVDRQSISSSFDVGDLNQSIGDICPILSNTYDQPLGTDEYSILGTRGDIL
jgi:hypothetical protein